MTLADFAYAQARLQAQHGRRPDDATWQLLEASRSAAQAIAQARSGPLAAWLQGLDERADAAAIERHLHARWQRQVDAVARWLPARWRAALQQFGRLPLLAAADEDSDANTLLAAWQADWQRSLPADAQPLRQVLRLPAQLLLPRLAGQRGGRATAAAVATQQRLQRLARRHPGSAVAVFSHLALQALELERLRGDLVVRALFNVAEAT
jgi:hypothetical protein